MQDPSRRSKREASGYVLRTWLSGAGLIDELDEERALQQLGVRHLKQLTRALMERARGAELTHHLGYDAAAATTGTARTARRCRAISVRSRSKWISQVTETVMEEVTAWQNRPIDPLYFSVYLDALLVKMRHAGGLESRARAQGHSQRLCGRAERISGGDRSGVPESRCSYAS
jgi:transposase-like protein